MGESGEMEQNSVLERMNSSVGARENGAAGRRLDRVTLKLKFYQAFSLSNISLIAIKKSSYGNSIENCQFKK